MKSLHAVGSAEANKEGAETEPPPFLTVPVLSACEKWLMLSSPAKMHGWHERPSLSHTSLCLLWITPPFWPSLQSSNMFPGAREGPFI